MNKSKLVILSVVVLFLVTSFFVYAFLQKSKNEKVIRNLEQKVSSLETRVSMKEKETTTPLATSPSKEYPTQVDNTNVNWETYSNNTYTFKYPGNISLTKEGELIKLYLYGKSQKIGGELQDGIMILFSPAFKIENTSLSEYVDQEIEKAKQFGDILKPKTKVSINGLQGYTYTSRGLGVSEYIYLQSPDKVWVVEIINATVDPTNRGYNDTVKQILSTFKFTK